eukprot:jgi/Mesvir1/6897/Mv09058-RA.1
MGNGDSEPTKGQGPTSPPPAGSTAQPQATKAGLSPTFQSEAMARDPLISFLSLVTLIVVASVLESGAVDAANVEWQRIDVSITKPNRGDTIPPALLFVTTALLFPFYAFIVELIRRRTSRDAGPYAATLGPTWWLLWAYWTALLVTDILTSILKLSFGRLRPSFIPTCKPDYSLLPLGTRDNALAWIYQDICTGSDWDVQAARRSFPSGHASSSAAGAFFVVLFLETCFKLADRGHKSIARASLGSWLQLIPLGIACFYAGSRYSDNKHFIADIVAGFLLGAVVAAALFHSLVLPVQRDMLDPAASMRTAPAGSVPACACGTGDGSTMMHPMGAAGGPTAYTV